ncbi:aminopeptidase N-like [Tigriopus californicus]|nr:aminopeptidase N-like [Tigriopus californicus]
MRQFLILLVVVGLGSALRPRINFPEARVKELGLARPKIEAASDGISNRIKSGYSKPVEEGGSLDLWCSFETRLESPQSCSWTRPEGSIFIVDNGIVTNEDSEVVEGITSNTTSDQDCHIQVAQLKQEQIGDWTCQFDVSDALPFQRSTLAVTDQLRITDVRLPGDFSPTSYNVFLTPFIIPDNFTIDGRVEVEAEVLQDTSTIKIHAKDMTILEDTVFINGDASSILGFGNDIAREFFILYLGSPLLKGSQVQITINFIGNLNDQLAGFYRSQYTTPEGEVRYIATTQFEATDARRAFPCFDEPALKATFQVSLGRLPTMSSISNMPIESEGQPMENNNEYVWDIYQKTVTMSTYLLAFVVSDFTFRQSDPLPNNVDFRIWSRESANSRTEYAAQVGPAVLAYYEDYFGVEFPLPKQDMIAIPDFSAGAMENWGLITYRETALLYDPEVSSAGQRVYIATVVAHELAHQWFGNLVTMKWWSDLWLNEGFAAYTEYIGADHVEPESAIKDKFVLESMYGTFEVDALESSHPISIDVNHPDEINEAFDGISYGKGASVIRMMANFLGIETFNKAITNYLKKYQYSNAAQDDLWNEITTTAIAEGQLDPDLTIKEIMDTWTLQKGFPVITVTVDTAKSQITCSQTRYLASEPEKGKSSQFDYKWWVPISYTTAGGDFQDTRNEFWLTPSDNGPKTFDISASESDAIIVNVQQTSFYRVNYDSANWESIAEALESDYETIHRVNRAQILDDAFNLAKVGLLTYEDALAQTRYLAGETDFIPWSAGLSGFAYIKSMFKREPGFGDLKEYLNRTLSPIYADLGFDSKPDDSFLNAELRTKVISSMCSLENRDCTNKAAAKFNEWMESPNPDSTNPIDPDKKSTVYCIAIGLGTELEWDFLWARFLNTDDASEQGTILSALGCTKEIWILQKYLDMVLDPDSSIRSQDGSRVVSSVANNVVGRDLAWGWVQEEWDRIVEVFDTAISSSVGRFVTSCTSSFNRPQQLAELEQFYDDHLDTLGTAKRDTENAIQTTKANIDWMNQYYQVIVDWLEDQLTPQ